MTTDADGSARRATPDAEAGRGARPAAAPDRVRVARAELVVVGPDAHALTRNLLQPDPKGAFARVQDQLRREASETAIAVVDLLPLSAWQRRRHRQRLLDEVRASQQAAGLLPAGGTGSGRLSEFAAGLGVRGGLRAAGVTGSLEQFAAGLGMRPPSRHGAAAGTRVGRVDDGARVAYQLERRQAALELARHEALFAAQVLLRATSRIPGREVINLRLLLSCFELFRGAASFEPAGVSVGVGDWQLAFLGADSWWRRWWFDYRFETGLFRPARRSIVSASEVAALLVPATRWCESDNVVRSGGAVPSAPNTLPTYRHQPQIMPLGRIVTARGGRLVGLHTRDTRFWGIFGTSGSGKTTVASLQVLWSALHARWQPPPGRHDHPLIGSLTLDPHGQMLEQLPDYLHAARDRLVILDIANRKPEQRVAAWNPLDMSGCDERDIEGRVKPLVDALALVNSWHSGRNSRAINLTQNTLTALAYLGLHLPADRQPTIFQMITFLQDTAWRNVLRRAADADGAPIVPKPQRDYFDDFFAVDASGRPKQQGDAVSAVLHTVYRLRASRTITAMFGQSRSAFDLRRAMDAGQVVIACLNAASELETKLIAAFLVFGLLRAAMSRIDIPREEHRRPFYSWLDEAHIYDGSSVADILREARKMLRGGVCVLDQDPKALHESTYRALATNGSHLLSGVVGQEEAVWITKQWGGQVEPATLMQLVVNGERPDGGKLFEYLARVTVDGRKTQVFKFEGAAPADVFASHHHPELRAEVEEAVDRNARRRLPGEVVRDLDTLDERIRQALEGRAAAAGPGKRRPKKAAGHQTYKRKPTAAS